MNYSSDYHDYVFKDGKFVGKFDEMYKYSKEIPWNQDTVPDTWHGRIGTNIIEAAFEEGKIKTVLETGCGYGYILSKINRPDVLLSGFDISETVIKKAQKLHPEFTFFVDDLINLKHTKKYDLVICRENLWYIIYSLNAVVENLNRLIVGGGYLYIGLSFPNLDKPFVGKEILPEHQALLKILEQDFDSVVLNSCQRLNIKEEGPMIHWLGQKKK